MEYNELIKDEKSKSDCSYSIYFEPIPVSIVRIGKKVAGKSNVFRYEVELSDGTVGKFDSKRIIESVLVLSFRYSGVETAIRLNDFNRDLHFNKDNNKTNCRSTHGYNWIDDSGILCSTRFVWLENDGSSSNRTHICIGSGFYGNLLPNRYVNVSRMVEIVDKGYFN